MTWAQFHGLVTFTMKGVDLDLVRAAMAPEFPFSLRTRSLVALGTCCGCSQRLDAIQCETLLYVPNHLGNVIMYNVVGTPKVTEI